MHELGNHGCELIGKSVALRLDGSTCECSVVVQAWHTHLGMVGAKAVAPAGERERDASYRACEAPYQAVVRGAKRNICHILRTGAPETKNFMDGVMWEKNTVIFEKKRE